MRVTFNELATRELNDAAQYYEHEQAGLCQRFPYGLLYSVVGGEIRILAVMNLKRRPGYWIGRD